MSDDVGIDWVQLTLPDALSHTVLQACYHAVGGEAPKTSTGRRVPGGQSYHTGLYWPNGMEFHYGGRDRAWMILPGTACGQFGFRAVRTLMQSAMMGGKCTRLDVRRDVRGDNITLVGDVRESCRSGHLRLLRSFQDFEGFEAAGVETVNDGVVLGSYSSPKFIRVYDKGLETGTAPWRRWVRFEGQLRDVYAHQAACRIFGADTVDASRLAALDVLHGVADFRAGPRGDGVHLDELDRPGWWSSFLAGIEGVRLSAPVLPADFERWRGWFQRVAGNVVRAAAESLGVPESAVFGLVMQDAEPTAGTRDNAMVGLIASAFSSTIGKDEAR